MDDSWRTRLAKLREEKGLAQADLAKLSGISQGHISLLENGKRKFTQETLDKLLEALGADYNQLFGKNQIKCKPELDINHKKWLEDKDKIIRMLEKEVHELRNTIQTYELKRQQQKRHDDPDDFDPTELRKQVYELFRG